MAHLFVNHHFFYGDLGFGQALKGPSPDIVRNQLRSLKQYIRPAPSVWSDLESSEKLVFSITIDDGSLSFLEVIPVFIEEGIHVSVCVCGVSTLQQNVLQIHKINLLRLELGDDEMWIRLCDTYKTDFSPERWPLKGNVVEETLYRYDGVYTRRLKIALNYQLNYGETRQFIAPLFLKIFGSEAEMCRLLYLNDDHLRQISLLPSIDIMFHGREHLLWAELTPPSHRAELTPPDFLQDVLSNKYVLSIPYGMQGAYDQERVINDAGCAAGAFTMDRTVLHQNRNSFYWLHRFDQADIFDGDGNVRSTLLADVFNQVRSL